MSESSPRPTIAIPFQHTMTPPAPRNDSFETPVTPDLSRSGSSTSSTLLLTPDDSGSHVAHRIERLSVVSKLPGLSPVLSAQDGGSMTASPIDLNEDERPEPHGEQSLANSLFLPMDDIEDEASMHESSEEERDPDEDVLTMTRGRLVKSKAVHDEENHEESAQLDEFIWVGSQLEVERKCEQDEQVEIQILPIWAEIDDGRYEADPQERAYFEIDEDWPGYGGIRGPENPFILKSSLDKSSASSPPSSCSKTLVRREPVRRDRPRPPPPDREDSIHEYDLREWRAVSFASSVTTDDGGSYPLVGDSFIPGDYCLGEPRRRISHTTDIMAHQFDWFFDVGGFDLDRPDTSTGPIAVPRAPDRPPIDERRCRQSAQFAYLQAMTLEVQLGTSMVPVIVRSAERRWSTQSILQVALQPAIDRPTSVGRAVESSRAMWSVANYRLDEMWWAERGEGARGLPRPRVVMSEAAQALDRAWQQSGQEINMVEGMRLWNEEVEKEEDLKLLRAERSRGRKRTENTSRWI